METFRVPMWGECSVEGEDNSLLLVLFSLNSQPFKTSCALYGLAGVTGWNLR